MALKAGHISKRISSKTDNLQEVREFVGSAARSFGFSEEDVANIILAVDEACTNIIKHAYQYASDKEIEISIFRDNKSFEIRIYDSGRPFDPSIIHPPDLKKYIGHQQRGGFGVYLMKRLMDKVEYNFQAGKQNEVRLTKFRTGNSTTEER